MSMMDFGPFKVMNVPRTSMANPPPEQFQIIFNNLSRAVPLQKGAWNDSKFGGLIYAYIPNYLDQLPDYGESQQSNPTANSTPKSNDLKEGDKVRKDKNGNNLVLRDCVPPEQITKNLQQNFFQIKNWIKPCQPHSDRAIIVSAGPSVNFDEIKALKAKHPNAKIVAVKHSYKACLAHGIIPDFCCLIDTRPVDQVSTLGYKRSSLLDDIRPETVFFMGTRSHESYSRFLNEKNARLYGYNVYFTKELKEAMEELDLDVFVDKQAEDAVVNLTATNAGMTAVGVMYVLGFRTMHIFGMDGNVPEPNEKQKKELDDIGYQKYYEVKMDDGKKFWTTGEFIYMGVDCMHFWSPEVTLKYGIKYYFHGENTFMRSIWDNKEKTFKYRPEYEDFFAQTRRQTIQAQS